MNTERNAWESSESKMQLSICTFHLQKTRPFHEFYQKLTEQSIRLPPTLCNYVRLDVAIVVLTRPHKTTGRFQRLCNHVIDQSVLIPDTSSLDIFLIFPAITTAHKLNVSKTTASLMGMYCFSVIGGILHSRQNLHSISSHNNNNNN